MKSFTTAIITLIAFAGALRAEREFFVFDNGLADIKSAGEQAALLKELGYDRICTRPQKASVSGKWPNRMIGGAGLPEAQRRTRTNMPLDAKGKLLPSGLLGPVRILIKTQQAEK